MPSLRRDHSADRRPTALTPAPRLRSPPSAVTAAAPRSSRCSSSPAGRSRAACRRRPSRARRAPAGARFAAAWERGDYAACTRCSRRRRAPRPRCALRPRVPSRARRPRRSPACAPAGRRARATTSIIVPFDSRTRIFGDLDAPVTLPLGEGADGEPAVAWAPHLVFPGLRPGEQLAARRRCPSARRSRPATARRSPRARRGCRSSTRSRPRSPAASAPRRPSGRTSWRRAAYPRAPRSASPGSSASSTPSSPARPAASCWRARACWRARRRSAGRGVRTTIDPDVQRAAVEALAGRYGGIAAVRPRNGEVLALAGVAFSAPQPPGSVFKIVTLAGALEAGTVERDEHFPVQTAATLEGVELENANGESCGGSLIDSFAHSCNSVFAPMGAELGAERLVATAERFGFNEDPGLVGAARSTIPAAARDRRRPRGRLDRDRAGQGARPRRCRWRSSRRRSARTGSAPRPTLLQGRADQAHAGDPAAGRPLRGRAMRAVVTGGTGVGAAVDGVTVAGKTGTAELRSTVSEDPVPPDPGEPPPAEDPTDTDAWFAAYAPAAQPADRGLRAADRQGAGGEVAAPAAAQVIDAAAARRRGRSALGAAAAVGELSSSGRFWSESVLSLKSSSRPWIGPCRRPSWAAGSRSWADVDRLERERVDAPVDRDRPVDVVLRVVDLPAGRGRPRLVLGGVLDPDPDAELDLVGGRLRRALGQPDAGTRDPRRRSGSCTATSGSGT